MRSLRKKGGVTATVLLLLLGVILVNWLMFSLLLSDKEVASKGVPIASDTVMNAPPFSCRTAFISQCGSAAASHKATCRRPFCSLASSLVSGRPYYSRCWFAVNHRYQILPSNGKCTYQQIQTFSTGSSSSWRDLSLWPLALWIKLGEEIGL